MVGKDLIMATLFGSGGGSSGSGGGGNIDENDGATYVHITLGEGRTSPMMGLCVSGTAAIDWGDGSDPDTLTGTSTTNPVWTESHAYAAPGDYVIRITVDGQMALNGTSNGNEYSYLLRYSSGADVRNEAYRMAIKRVVMGDGINHTMTSSFRYCSALSSVVIPDSAKYFNSYIFAFCGGLASVTFPHETKMIGSSAFYYCRGLAWVDFTACTAVPTLEGTSAFNGIPDDCEIRVPAALYDEWIAATNWATYADNIKAY